jgi:hypothetical protein
VADIPGSEPKGTLPDKITNGAKADPNVTAIPAGPPVLTVLPDEPDDEPTAK